MGPGNAGGQVVEGDRPLIIDDPEPQPPNHLEIAGLIEAVGRQRRHRPITILPRRCIPGPSRKAHAFCSLCPSLGRIIRQIGGRLDLPRFSVASIACPREIARAVVARHRQGRGLAALLLLRLSIRWARSEENTSELQSLMRNSYAV